MTVQPSLCLTCFETTLLVFPRGGSYVCYKMKQPVNTYNELVIGDEGERLSHKDFPTVEGHAEVFCGQSVTGSEVVDHRCKYTGVVWSLQIIQQN